LSDDEQHMAEVGYDYFLNSILPPAESGNSLRVLSEQRLDVVSENFSPITFGTADVVVPHTPTNGSIVYDWKTGREPRDYSAQMACYALGAMQQYGTEHCVTFCIYLRMGDAGVYRQEWSYGEAYKRVMSIYRSVTNPDKQPTPHPRACQWCAKRLTCSSVHALAVDVAQNYAPEKLEAALAEYHPSRITDPDQMSIALQIREVLEKWCSSVKHHAEQMAATEQIPGYAVKEGNTNRSVTDITAAYAASGLSPEEFLSACKVSVAKLEDAIRAQEDCTKAEAKERLNQRLGALIERSTGKPSLRKEKK
jgi:hypothetical protein